MNPARLASAALCAALCVVPSLRLLSTSNPQPVSPMQLESLTPNILVEDMDRSLAFYRDRLGFAVAASVPEAPPYNWAMLRRDGVTIMVQTRASLEDDQPALKNRPAGGALTFFIQMQGIDDLYADLHAHAPVVQEPTDTFYGMREFSVTDPDGFVITFAERLP